MSRAGGRPVCGSIAPVHKHRVLQSVPAHCCLVLVESTTGLEFAARSRAKGAQARMRGGLKADRWYPRTTAETCEWPAKSLRRRVTPCDRREQHTDTANRAS